MKNLDEYFTGRLSKGTLDLDSGPKLFGRSCILGLGLGLVLVLGRGGGGGGLTLDMDEMSRRKNFTLFVVQQA